MLHQVSKASSCSFWIDLHDANGISYSSNSHPPSSGSPPWLCEGGLGLAGQNVPSFPTDCQGTNWHVGLAQANPALNKGFTTMPQGQWCQLMNLLDSFDNGRVICLLKHCWLGIVLSNSDLSCLRELDLPCFFVAITSFLTWLSLPKNIRLPQIPVVPHKAVAEVSKIGNL